MIHRLSTSLYRLILSSSHILSSRRCSLAFVLVLAACGKPAEAPKPVVPGAQVEGEVITFPADSPQLNALRVVEALRDRESFVRINGRLSWDESRTTRVNAPLNGRVLDIAAQPGASVSKGQVLARMSSADFGMMQSESRRAQIDLQAAQRNLARVSELVSAGVAPLKEQLAAQTEVDLALAERDRTLVRERALGAQAGSADQLFSLRAPISGVVVERRINPGQELRSESSGESSLFVISDPRQLWVTLDVPEALTQEIQVGESIRVMVPALPGEVFQARINYVADAIDPQTRTVKARASVDNVLRRLKAEMYVTADVDVPSSAALRVPATALFLQGDKYFAFVEQAPGQFGRRVVKAEESTLGQMRVTQGLQLKERVVADGALLLQQMLNQKATSPNKSAK